MNKILSFATVIFVLLTNVQAQKNTNTFNTLITETSFAGITKNTTLQDLYKLFGRQNVSTGLDFGPEGGDSIVTTVIFKGTSKELVIFWKENKKFKTIELVRCTAENALYTTTTQIKIGTPLSKLLSLNKNKITFSGFGWDYGGIISSYNNGKLANSKINFVLSINNDASNKLSGEANFNTDMPLVKKYLTKIYIVSISIAFN